MKVLWFCSANHSCKWKVKYGFVAIQCIAKGIRSERVHCRCHVYFTFFFIRDLCHVYFTLCFFVIQDLSGTLILTVQTSLSQGWKNWSKFMVLPSNPASYSRTMLLTHPKSFIQNKSPQQCHYIAI